MHLGILNPVLFGTTHTCLVALAIEHVSSCDIMSFEGLQSEVQSCRLEKYGTWAMRNALCLSKFL